MLDKDQKQKIIKKTGIHATDTGSAEVQIAILTERIEELSKHLQQHKKDFSSRRGLLTMIIKRKRLLNWLKINYPIRYKKLVEQLKIKET
jgi:small subunit ribosomal protein S15